MTRPCSHCNGHNPRTCSTRGGGGGLRLFGVRLTDGSFIHKSASMGNLSHYSAAAAADSMEGYHSDYNRRPLRRKKGIPWTEEEHRQFLLGLHKLGRGNWRGISRNYVCSRTPTQVASHAQKYFIRQSNATGKKKRPSVFDMESDSSKPEQCATIQFPAVSTDEEKLAQEAAYINNSLPCLDLSLKLDFTPPNEAQAAPEEAMKEVVGMSQLTLL